MKNPFITLCLAAMALLAATGCNSNDSVKEAQQANEAKADRATTDDAVGQVAQKGLDYDAEFLAKAASGGMLEVELGKQVATRAITPEARKFAQQMIDDHSKGNAELMALATQKNITLPTTLGDDHQKVLKKVTEEKGVKMDQQYIHAMLEDHEEDVKEYTDAAVKASDPDIKAFAAKTIPMLKMHLDMVTKMKPTVDAAK